MNLFMLVLPVLQVPGYYLEAVSKAAKTEVLK